MEECSDKPFQQSPQSISRGNLHGWGPENVLSTMYFQPWCFLFLNRRTSNVFIWNDGSVLMAGPGNMPLLLIHRQCLVGYSSGSANMRGNNCNLPGKPLHYAMPQSDAGTLRVGMVCPQYCRRYFSYWGTKRGKTWALDIVLRGCVVLLEQKINQA